jgi:hypothetical protein
MMILIDCVKTVSAIRLSLGCEAEVLTGIVVAHVGDQLAE